VNPPLRGDSQQRRLNRGGLRSGGG
jgi:hypothetical protein